MMLTEFMSACDVNASGGWQRCEKSVMEKMVLPHLGISCVWAPIHALLPSSPAKQNSTDIPLLGKCSQYEV
jgi:hypothetical protein